MVNIYSSDRLIVFTKEKCLQRAILTHKANRMKSFLQQLNGMYRLGHILNKIGLVEYVESAHKDQPVQSSNLIRIFVVLLLTLYHIIGFFDLGLYCLFQYA